MEGPSTPNPWTHVTQILSVDGSAINNVIRALSYEAAQFGIDSIVAASDNRHYDFPNATMAPVDFTKYLQHEYLSDRQKMADALTGRVGLGRRNVTKFFSSVAEAIESSNGPIIIHDGFMGAAGLQTMKEAYPARPRYLYVHNALSRSYSRRELRQFLRAADGVICVSDAILRTIAERVADTTIEEKLVTVLNGIDTHRFHPSDSEFDAQIVPSVLFVGLMTHFKGPHILLQALQRLHQEGVPFSATFIGSSSHASAPLSAYEKQLRQDAAGLDQVRFLPYVNYDMVQDEYRKSQIQVVPSQFEDPAPLVLLEAMASGLAVVASRRGGIPELGGDSIQYFDDPSSLTEILRGLLADVSQRRRWSQRARQRAEELTWKEVFTKVRSVIDQAR